MANRVVSGTRYFGGRETKICVPTRLPKTARSFLDRRRRRRVPHKYYLLCIYIFFFFTRRARTRDISRAPRGHTAPTRQPVRAAAPIAVNENNVCV